MQEEGNGGFLFISHSHKDMDKVRQLRNKLEEAGYEPLCFYLKALDDSKEELDDLIKREIDARQWFVYVESDNSRESDWVQKERKWRKRDESKNKQEFKWNLESNSIEELSEALITGLLVNIIYSHSDYDFVNKLVNKLQKKDLQVTYDSISGTNIVILSQNSIHSEYVTREVLYAIEKNSKIIPIFIDDVDLTENPSLNLMLGATQSIFTRITTENDLDNFIEETVSKINKLLDEFL